MPVLYTFILLAAETGHIFDSVTVMNIQTLSQEFKQFSHKHKSSEW